MANDCYNLITLKGETHRLLNALTRFKDAPRDENYNDGWAAVVLAMADELNLCHADSVKRMPYETEMSMKHGEDGRSTFAISFSTKWWFDEDLIYVMATVFSDCDMDFYAEEFASEGGVRLQWVQGALTSHEEVEEIISSNDDDWLTAVRWSSSGWEVEYQNLTPDELFSILVASLDSEVRHSAATHADIPGSLLIRLLNDEDEDVVSAAWENKALTYEVVESAVRSKHGLPDSFSLESFPREILAQYLMEDSSAPVT